MFQAIAFIIFGIILIGVYMYSNKSISIYGFNCMNVFVLIYTVFYLCVPLISIFLKRYRDETTLYNLVLNSKSDEVIFINFLICTGILVLILFLYHNIGKKKELEIKTEIMNKVNEIIYKKVTRTTDLFLAIGVISILVVVLSAGGITKYLALGSSARGVTSNLSDHISKGVIPLITLSVLILVCPYVYYYLYRVKREKIVMAKFIISLVLSILYLVYNQGRAPLVLFLLPFFLVSNFMKKRSLIKIILIFIISLPILNILNGFFLYLSYGIYRSTDHNIFYTILLEFSYPFTNFVSRSALVTISGFRYGLDYLYWIIAIVPDSILGLIGVSKTRLDLLGTLNTEAYNNMINTENRGGIPVDFLTFNYYEGGYLTLLFGIVFTVFIIKFIDNRFSLLKNNLLINILLLRISLSIINIMPNSDWSVIVRTRTDIIILVIYIIYISYKSKKINSLVQLTENVN